MPPVRHPSDRRNVVLILTDQQHAGMMSCAANPWLRTPSMDALAAGGTRFERAYCANPVCLPSRLAMLTGHYAGSCGVRSDADVDCPVPEALVARSMGHVFREAGYETLYGGKVHLPRPTSLEAMGFESLPAASSGRLEDACAAYLRHGARRPFLLVASFTNPHDICYMALNDYAPCAVPDALVEALKMPPGVSRDEFFSRYCPPLPEGFEPPADEPRAVARLLRERPFKHHARTTWSPETWRLHRWAYCRLTEAVDAQIGRLLDALRDAGLEQSTVVALTSDHGDMDAARRMEHKSVFYEPASRVPLIVRSPGARGGLVDREHLVSAGVDLLATLCDCAGLATPAGLDGRSARALVEGRRPGDWRDSLLIESQIGRLVHTGRYKYAAYDPPDEAEELFDLVADAGETVNLAREPARREVLEAHRRRLRRAVESSLDRRKGLF